MNKITSRRGFIKNSVLASASVAAQYSPLNTTSFYNSSKGLVFLFQGDSITDGNRGRNKDPNHIMGHGYAFSIASRVGADFAESNHVFYNRGISGNQVTDLQSRWQKDTLDLKPDVLSILVGINDASVNIRKLDVGKNFFDLFEKNYQDILIKTIDQNKDTLLVLCLPFAFPVGKVKDSWLQYNSALAEMGMRIKKIANDFNAVVVDFVPIFEKKFKKAKEEYWIWDGIHPTVAGHELMAREWIKQVSKKLHFLKKY